MGIVAHPLRGRRNPDQVEHSLRFIPGAACIAATVGSHRLRNLLTYRHGRIQRGHRLLEDHRHLLAAYLVEFLLGQADQFASFEHDAAGLNTPRLLGQQAHHGQGGDALAAA